MAAVADGCDDGGMSAGAASGCQPDTTGCRPAWSLVPDTVRPKRQQIPGKRMTPYDVAVMTRLTEKELQVADKCMDKSSHESTGWVWNWGRDCDVVISLGKGVE